ncbi:PAS domain-containing protein, partial [bacterium]|nr:PAS domain-containing protein [bacterium]
LQQALADAFSVGLANLDLLLAMQDARQVAEQSASAALESEQRLQLALDANRDGLWDWDLRTGKVYRSQRYYELTGRNRDTSTPDFEFFKSTVAADDLPRVLAIIEAHKQGLTEAINFEYRLATDNGELKWMEGRGRAVERDASGAPLRI